MASILETLIALAVLFGCVAAWWLGFYWNRSPTIQALARSDFAKLISSAIKFVSAAYMAYSLTRDAADRNPVMPYACASALFIWEVVDLVVKRKDARAFEDITTVKAIADRRARLLSCFQSLVGEKLNLIREQIGQVGNTSKAKWKAVRKAFGNKEHIDQLLHQVCLYFSRFNADFADDPNLNLRVAFYVAGSDRDQLDVPYSYDHKQGAKAVHRSFRDHPERFRLTCHNRPSQAVICIREHRTIIIEDTENVLDFDRTEQKNYLKSLVAHPISGYGVSASDGIPCCLVIDANIAGFFRNDDRQEIELVLENFAHRLRLEFLVRDLIHKEPTETENRP